MLVTSVTASFVSIFKAFQGLRVTAMTHLLRSQQSLATGLANITLSLMRPLCKARLVDHRSFEVAVKRLQLLQNLLAGRNRAKAGDTKLDRSIQFRVRHISEVLVDSLIFCGLIYGLTCFNPVSCHQLNGPTSTYRHRFILICSNTRPSRTLMPTPQALQ